MSLVKHLVQLLHCLRRNISAQDADEIVAEALAKMQDMRAARCIEGVIMLVTCLPTAYAKYDELLAEAMRIWPQIDHNPGKRALRKRQHPLITKTCNT